MSGDGIVSDHDGMSDWIDVSVPLYNGMVHWPGDEPFHREEMKQMARGDICNVSKMCCTVHIGTHMDAPHHFIKDGCGMAAMPLDATIGPARVIHIDDPEAIHAPDLEPHNIAAGERILFRTRNSGVVWSGDDFKKKFVYIAQDAARRLASAGVRTVGVDYLSVGGFEIDSAETHQALLGAGVWIIEGLNLAAVEPGEYDLICLPLKIVGSDGAPARAVLRKRPS